MNSGRFNWVSWGTLAAAVGLLVLAGWLSQGLANERDEHQIGLTRQDEAPPPPTVTLASTLGGPVRAGAVLFLWHRANELKDAGQYAEANQWSRWITDLQPGFPAVWYFHAWNMAYNISVTTSTPRERWFWVDSGVRLLRERGLRYNPRAYMLYRELGYIFIHKIGAYSDDMHWYYKRRLALEWQELLGVAFPGQDPVERMRLVAEAPDSLSELRRSDPAIAELMDELRRTGYEIDINLLRTIGRIDMVPQSRAAELYQNGVFADTDFFDRSTLPPPPDDAISVLIRSIRDQRGSSREQALEAILNTLRKRELQDRYNMDARLMWQMMAGVEGDPDLFGYGPLDWRHPASHSLYWTTLGVRAIEDGRLISQADVVNTRRQILHGLQAKFHEGRIFFDPLVQDPRVRPSLADRSSPVDRTLSASPLRYSSNLAFAQAYETAFQRAIEVVGRDDVRGSAQAYKGGHENLLLDVVLQSWLSGDFDMARQWVNRARDLYAREPHNIRSGRYEQDLTTFVTELFVDNLELLRNINAFITVMLEQGIDRGLLEGNLESYANFRAEAEKAYRRFMETRRDDVAAVQGRMQLPPFSEIERQIFMELIVGKSQFGRPLPLLERHRVWTYAPGYLREAAYPQVADELRRQCEAVGFDFETTFPAPTPMAAQ
ncbi:MAG: hypothetical protein JJU36_11195 [Phycisphaeraceae bacterium]|nr:hypothetical protein [Phycisphaeraceae bacterium]